MATATPLRADDAMQRAAKLQPPKQSLEDARAGTGGAAADPPPISAHSVTSADPGLESLWCRAESTWLRESARHSADGWVWERGDRDALVPITGSVPFNAEPSLDNLVENIVTPTKLHHVRNHGPVPKIDPDLYRLKICVEGKKRGARDDAATPSDEQPESALREWSLSELKSLPSTSLLITITCDGFRRKELNQIEHTKGVNTGPGATGTSRWTGVLLSELLRRSDVPSDIAHPFVVFDGLDAPAKGFYGTSLPSAQALDPRAQVLIAWAQNDEPLTPDHGAPIRLVVPGYIGGRSVKWLGRVALSHQESPSQYHAEDNVLLPSSVSITQWNSGELFRKPEHVLYEQIVNSVIAKPSHDEWIALEKGPATMIPVEGFAMAGGGRRIMRVEVSADQGKTWMEAKIKYADTNETDSQQPRQAAPSNRSDAEEKHAGTDQKEDAHGGKKSAADSGRPESSESTPSGPSVFAARLRCWSWCFWSCTIPAWHLLSPGHDREIIVRAFDEGFNSQAPDLRWNVMGMFNNAYYRLRVETRMPQGLEGMTYLRCLHPVLPAELEGGWQKAAPAAVGHFARLGSLPRTGPSLGLAAHRAHKLISMQEVSQHQSVDDCWIVLDSTVYDVTPYMKDHPGSGAALLAATKVPHSELSPLFKSIHAADALEITGRFAIGVLAPQELIDALDAYQPPVPQQQQGSPHLQRVFLERLNSDPDDAEMRGAKLALSSSKEAREQAHRRSNWQERPDPNLMHPQTGLSLFPSKRSGRTFLLHSTRWCAIKLLEVREISHDTKLFTFGAAQGSFDAIGLMTGQHLLLSALVEKEQVVRPYTPVWPVSMGDEIEAAAVTEVVKSPPPKEGRASPSETAQAGASARAAPSRHPNAQFELLIKIYRRHGVMPGGKLTSFLDRLTLDANATLRVKGPTGHVLYLGGGYFNIHGASVQVRRINLIGGGTGITPLWQLMRTILDSQHSEEHQSGVQLSLVYANKSVDDILMREQLEELAAAHSKRARIVHVLSRELPPKQAVPNQRAVAITRQLSPRAVAGSDEVASSQPPPSPHCRSGSGAGQRSPRFQSPPAPNVSIEHGHVNAFVFRRHLFPPSSSTLTFICGPPPMIGATFNHLLALGFADEAVVEF